MGDMPTSHVHKINTKKKVFFDKSNDIGAGGVMW